MLVRFVTVLFYLLLAAFFLGVGFPYLELVLGISALILGVLALIS